MTRIEQMRGQLRFPHGPRYPVPRRIGTARMLWDILLDTGWLVLLHRPSWVFMDEATSALDEASQEAVLSLSEGELADASALSIGHRPGLEAFHTRVLHFRQTREGTVHLSSSPVDRTSAAGRWGRQAGQAEAASDVHRLPLERCGLRSA